MRWLALVLLLATGPALAHSWYPNECCNDRDCEMVAAKDMRRSDKGWILPNGETVPFGSERQSLDDQFHWCRYLQGGGLIRPAFRPPCFFAPPGGV